LHGAGQRRDRFPQGLRVLHGGLGLQQPLVGGLAEFGAARHVGHALPQRPPAPLAPRLTSGRRNTRKSLGFWSVVSARSTEPLSYIFSELPLRRYLIRTPSARRRTSLDTSPAKFPQGMPSDFTRRPRNRRTSPGP
jgi:hypothetical protein